MRLRDLDYELPPELIAQHPSPRREDARLLVVERSSGALHDTHVARIGDWLRPGDVLAVNETRVMPARLEVRRPTGGAVELLFVRAEADGTWRTLARPAKRAATGQLLATADGALELEVIAQGDGGERVVRVRRGDLHAVLHSAGRLPLPPYIHRAPDAENVER